MRLSGNETSVLVWDKLCEAVGGEQKVIGTCTMFKLSQKKKDVLQHFAEAERLARSTHQATWICSKLKRLLSNLGVTGAAQKRSCLCSKTSKM